MRKIITNTIFISFLLFSSPSLACEDSSPICVFTNYSVSAPPHGVGSAKVKEAIAQSAMRHGVQIVDALAVANLESKFRCDAVGRAGELGPLQIKPSTARSLGYVGPISALRSCGAGLEWGMRHLALAFAHCGHAGQHQGGLGSGCRVTSYAAKVRAMRRNMSIPM